MGASLVCRVLPDMSPEELRKRVQAIRDEAAYNDGHQYSGDWNMNPGLDIVAGQVFANRAEAERYIEERAQKWEALLAVRVRRLRPRAEVEQTKQGQQVRARIQQLSTAVADFPRQVIARVRQGASKTRGCRHCGSAIAVSHLRSTRCPVCSEEFLLTETDKAALARHKVQLAAAETAWAELCQVKTKPGTPPALEWVVGGWCAS